MGLDTKDFLKLSMLTLVIVGLFMTWLAFGERGFIHLYRMEKERQVYLAKIRELEKANEVREAKIAKNVKIAKEV